LLLATTSPMALYNFFRRQALDIQQAGFRIEAASAPGEKLARFASETGLVTHALPLERPIRPVADLLALYRFWKLIRRFRPAIVHTHTPKAGLLGMLAARAAGTPIRIYTINGLVLETRRGWRRWLLKVTERVACGLATEVIAVSHSLARAIVELRLCDRRKLRVLGHGASHGVDLERYPTTWGSAGERLRRELGIPEDGLVIGFVGRIVGDKGIKELAAAWRILRDQYTRLHLLLCGAFEPAEAVSRRTRRALEDDPRVHLIGERDPEMPAVYSAIDIVVLPSRREGLPNVALEAAAMRRPLVGTRVTGLVDAVVDGETGLLVNAGDAPALAVAVGRLVSDHALRRQMGEAARWYVAARFDQRDVSRRLIEEYRRLIEASGVRPRLRRKTAREDTDAATVEARV